ncbi:MAG TPA: response regulator transcription factor [Terriglobales bacterium]|nr:response regulator transcription factor [Terriglobales bacterium]
MRILLAVDSALDRRTISTCLRQWGLDLVVAENGTDAWQALQGADAPSLAILDWVLPGIEGIELCRRIRTLGENGSYVYTVMLTSKNRKQDLLAATEAGADDYLAKPIDPAELKARILVGKRILDLQQSLRFAATHDFLTGAFKPRRDLSVSRTGTLAQRAGGQGRGSHFGRSGPLQRCQ